MDKSEKETLTAKKILSHQRANEFRQGLDLAGLGDAFLELELYGAVAPRSENSEEADLCRTNIGNTTWNEILQV